MTDRQRISLALAELCTLNNGMMWKPFTCAGKTYTFDHLAPYIFKIEDSQKVERLISVSFTDHVFTRKIEGIDDYQPTFPDCSRPNGVFCSARYEISKILPEAIKTFTSRDVWLVCGNHYAHIPFTLSEGRTIAFAILFSLDRVTGLPHDLRMVIRSAYECTKAPDTFGNVKFRHLVSLRMQHKHPRKQTDRNRKRPRVLL